MDICSVNNSNLFAFYNMSKVHYHWTGVCATELNNQLKNERFMVKC